MMTNNSLQVDAKNGHAGEGSRQQWIPPTARVLPVVQGTLGGVVPFFHEATTVEIKVDGGHHIPGYVPTLGSSKAGVSITFNLHGKKS